MRYRILVLLMLLGVATVAPAQVNIGINFSTFPSLVRVPGYPVYYAPRQATNYFFYDGMYWVFQNDEWYSSSWYNGPWWQADPEYVPEYILRVPVRYFRRPPAYFHGWQGNAPPHWGEHWGNDWEQHRRGWDQWNHNAAPPPAPLPVYQRQYSGARYPKAEQQQVLQTRNYHYQPKDALVREHFEPKTHGASAPAVQEKQAEPARKQAESPRKDSAKDERAQKSAQPAQKSEPAPQRQQPRPPVTTPREPAAVPREQPAPKPANQPQRPEHQAAPQHEQQAPKPAAQAQRPEHPAAPQHEQPAPRPAAQPPRPEHPAAPQHEQPAPRPAAQPPRPQPQAAHAPAAEPHRAEEKGPEKEKEKEKGR